MGRTVILCGLLAGGVWAWGAGALGDEPARAGLETPGAGEERLDSAAVPARAPRHEALAPVPADVDEEGAESIPKGPPAAVAERPGTGPSKPGAQWVRGYWAWDKASGDYVWVTGTWQVPPPGRFWVNGYWKRGARGWYRVPGFWSARVDGQPERQVDWKKDGPPDAPDEDPGAPPGPNHFYVAGVYAPDARGQDLVWKPGFWYPVQRGWEWVPARWVRRSSGWTYREGSWHRAEVTAENDGAQPLPRATVVPPGYPVYDRGYGPMPGTLRGRIGGFFNQVLP
jgi:hypothetical protein